MRPLTDPVISPARRLDLELKLYGGPGDARGGVFQLRSQTSGQMLHIVASCDEGWDHISVSYHNRCPSWEEMEQVKRFFFKVWEVAMQLHVASEDHISRHPYCLHLWRPHDAHIPLPPKALV